MKSDQILKIALGILIILLLLGGFWAFRLSSSNAKMKAENDQLNAEFKELSDLRKDLEREVDSLQLAYADLAAENDSLYTVVGEVEASNARKDAFIRRLKRDVIEGQEAMVDVANMREEIARLTSEKTDLLASIQGLQEENRQLKDEVAALTEEVGAERKKNEELTNTQARLEEEINRLTLATFRASAFRVEVEKRNTKATAKGRQARRIKVSFDLLNVKDEFRGTRPIYLVVTDDKGTPIKTDNPVQATVTTDGQTQQLMAVKSQQVNIAENQRLSFNHELTERLNRGFYKVLVYTDIGLIGGSSFRIR